MALLLEPASVRRVQNRSVSGRACGRGRKAPKLFQRFHDDITPGVVHAFAGAAASQHCDLCAAEIPCCDCEQDTKIKIKEQKKGLREEPF
jgi:hypothetical protein